MSAPLVADIENLSLHECSPFCRYRGSYMSAHVLLNLLNELGKSDKMPSLPSISLFAKSLINSIIQEHEC